MTPTRTFRALGVGLLLCCLTGSLPLTAAAQETRPAVSHAVARILTFQGAVTEVVGPGTNPSAFTVVTRAGRSLVFRVVPSTRFHALSAEAAVQGFVSGDYVDVEAVRVNRDWVASNITYDVAPLPALHSVSGRVVRVAPDGLRFLVRLDSGVTRWFPIPAGVKVKYNGDASTPSVIVRGCGVVIIQEKTDRDWAVIEIDVTPAAHFQQTGREVAS